MDNILLFILLNFYMFLVLSVVIVIIKLSSLGLKYFSLKIELKHHVDENQDKEEDDGDDGDDEEEDSEEVDELIIIPMPSRRVTVAVGTALKDAAVINGGLPDGEVMKGRKNQIHVNLMFVAFVWKLGLGVEIIKLVIFLVGIYMECHALRYGFIVECPQCNISCKLKDVRLLYATRLCIAGRTLRKFPFTEKGFSELKEHMGWRLSERARESRAPPQSLLIRTYKFHLLLCPTRPSLFHSPQIPTSHSQLRDGDLPIHIRVCQRGTPRQTL
ncbi:hypothetical protein L1987_67707 [Smallanthus sonchifolius]|uniref:Uncharacterized protein n=1 Tax=Smallanthus sonchifolius TaxID=185202 RepID=A0ACB9B2U0_9ASTR|nr:hypothetical protein L1987_67707 [Smallanthus sonchifolius]